ncbi:UNVERIFIED_CONTAM: hypothetical protein PYX00_008293 [Menopon gallinae]|uniref:DNA/pantothenate metabolism flavoprotein C-terminal domain-containing protein n=1 Tax=Menopon gallinae TaxID=328185 RepID=A0AAW2HNN5_9NEOP
MSNWEEFYSKSPKPDNYKEDVIKIERFVEQHSKRGQKIALVTSGGTTVPLEHNTVRFVDNFSAGTRGSASAEFFLQYEYAVIFLFRLKSLEPFVRHLMGHAFLDSLEIVDETKIKVKDSKIPDMMPVLMRYNAVKKSGCLLSISFTTLSDYLWLLRACCDSLSKCGNRALIFLAAAVSDFYIPTENLPAHKIQSREGPLNITLQLVPKILKPLVSTWVPKAFIVSFKLETDESLLISKAKDALKTYNHNLVIGNILNTRKYKVTIVTKDSYYDIGISPEESLKGIEIESRIVEDVSRRHEEFCRLSRK